VALGSQVIDLFGAHLVEEVGELARIGKVAIVQEEARIGVVRVLVQVVDPLRVERAGPADQPVYDVALGEQQLCQVGAILPGDTSDQCDLHLFSSCRNPW